MSVQWNPWHGCSRISEGCRNCYVFRIDGGHGMDAGEVRINRDYLLPLKKSRDGSPKIPSGETVYTCFSSDFLLPNADDWRGDAWKMMHEREDLHFIFFTKRIDRLGDVLPPDWGDGYPNVTIGCTCENQDRADYRLPIFLNLPIQNRVIVCEPLLEQVDLRPYLTYGKIEAVLVGGESGDRARPCNFDWVADISHACRENHVRFSYHQTGAILIRDGKTYHIPRNLQHIQAEKAQKILTEVQSSE